MEVTAYAPCCARVKLHLISFWSTQAKTFLVEDYKLAQGIPQVNLVWLVKSKIANLFSVYSEAAWYSLTHGYSL